MHDYYMDNFVECLISRCTCTYQVPLIEMTSSHLKRGDKN